MNEKLALTALLGFIIIGAALIVFFSFPFGNTSNSATGQGALASAHDSEMPFTAFDRALAAELMDKDGDGKCDACGMAIKDCIASNMLQCNMDPKATIGLLGSAHAHAEFRVYVNGAQIDFSKYAELHEEAMQNKSAETSSFIHVHEEEAPHKAGEILHMHASGVPLWVFFESIGMEFSKNCLKIQAGEEFCNAPEKTLKFYVNGRQNSSFENYAPKDDDKILISYGSESEDEIKGQLDSV
ncbi:MAG: hypothetical protein HYW05_02905 [Candidatus Diapherotrites archaeon]|nr:hypothetical protein [Candidatus Diapherotrites archaeon]